VIFSPNVLLPFQEYLAVYFPREKMAMQCADEDDRYNLCRSETYLSEAVDLCKV